MALAASSKSANTPLATNATMDEPMEHASCVCERTTGKPNTSAAIWQTTSLFAPPPPMRISWMVRPERSSMMRSAI